MNLTLFQSSNPVFIISLAIGAGFATSLLVTAVARKVACRYGIMDHPDLRKTHRDPIPYLGGVGLFCGIFAGLFAAWIAGDWPKPDRAAGLVAGSLLIIHATGLIDDIKGTKPTTKMTGQLLTAAVLWFLPGSSMLARDILIVGGLSDPPDFMVHAVSAAGSVALVLGATNAMNLIDGLDGLCASLSSVAQLGCAAIAISILGRNPEDAYAKLALLLSAATFGANLGYLKWNWFPARIFMGDAGSLLQGNLIAAQALLLASSAPQGRPGLCFLQSFGVVVVFGVPVADTALAILRRKLHGKPIMTPDALHLHHLLRRHFSVRVTVGILCLCAAGCSLMGVAVSVGWPSVWGALGIMTVGIGGAMAWGYWAATHQGKE